MDYSDWIERERRVRVKILNSAPLIQNEHMYRLCKDCGEICLCHEETCPNCNSQNIKQQVLAFQDIHDIEMKIRCKSDITI
jgi:uncharacterized OB-fold protein